MIILIEATMLILVRTHYIIDLVAGIICAQYFSIWAECMTIVWDVWLLGLPARKRGVFFFRPCARCGWSNNCAASRIDEQEFRTQMYQLTKKIS